MDPLQRWVKIADGNDYSTVTARLGPYIDLAREQGVHLALVHHSRKGGGEHGEEVLGSTAFSGSVDTVLSLRVGSEGRRVFYATGRDGVQVEKTVLVMDDRGWVDVGETKREADQTDKADEILAFLKHQPEPVKEKTINVEVGGNRAVFQKALRGLVAEGFVERAGSGKRGDPYLYSFLVPGTGTIE